MGSASGSGGGAAAWAAGALAAAKRCYRTDALRVLSLWWVLGSVIGSYCENYATNLFEVIAPDTDDNGHVTFVTRSLCCGAALLAIRTERAASAAGVLPYVAGTAVAFLLLCCLASSTSLPGANGTACCMRWPGPALLPHLAARGWDPLPFINRSLRPLNTALFTSLLAPQPPTCRMRRRWPSFSSSRRRSSLRAPTRWTRPRRTQRPALPAGATRGAEGATQCSSL